MDTLFIPNISLRPYNVHHYLRMHRLIKAPLKITIAITPGVPLALHERVQLTQPCNTTAEFQWLHGVVDQNPDKCPDR